MIEALVPFVAEAGGVALFLGVCSMLIGMLVSAFTGRSESRGRVL